MGFLAPLGLVALPLLGIILALYLLKLRRPMAPVGSLHLWDSLTRDREANSLWQRLRVSMLLLLQLVALLLMVLALARPWLPSSERIGQHAIIVVDVSASMSAPAEPGRRDKTRLDAARAKAIDIVDNLPQDGTATLISSDEHASVVVPATGDRARLRNAINALKPEARGTDMTEALKLAGATAARQDNSVAWVLSDGAFPSLKDRVEPLQADLRFVPFGSGLQNQAVTALSLQQQAGSLQLFVQIANSEDVTVTRRLDLTVDDSPWAARTLTIPPDATQELVLDDLPIGARVVQAALAGEDDVALDDTAWVVNRSSAPANVLLVTPGNTFLELALSLLPTVNLYKVAPGEYKPAGKVDGAPVDLTIFDAGITGTLLSALPVGNILLIDPPAANPVISVTGVITDPIPSTGSFSTVDSVAGDPAAVPTDPLLRYVDLSQVHIASAAQVETPKWGRVVLSSDKGPLLVIGDESARKVAVVAFDLHDSDLALQTAFPMLVRNLVTSLLPVPAGGLPAVVDPGTSVGIDPPSAGVASITVEDPAAKDWSYPVVTGTTRVAFAETEQPGVYYVSYYGNGTGGKEVAPLLGQEAFAVNFLSREESTALPVRSPDLPVVASAPSGSAPAAAAQETFKREAWPLVALGGFLILLVEWTYAQRIAIRRAVTEWQTRRGVSRET
ncbi:MAG: vWA domain-containing protein [Chloroflexia bacterium]